MICKQEWMAIIAGEELVNALDAEQKLKVPRTTEGYYESEPLCRLQSEQNKRGIVGVEIVTSAYGASVRYDSGLQDFGLLASSKSKQLDGTIENACKYAKEWVAKDPTRRYAWMRK